MSTDEDKISRVRAMILELGPTFQPTVPIETVGAASVASSVVAGFKAQRRQIGSAGGLTRKATYKPRDEMIRLMASGLRIEGHRSRKWIAEQVHLHLRDKHPHLTVDRIYRLIGSK